MDRIHYPAPYPNPYLNSNLSLPPHTHIHEYTIFLLSQERVCVESVTAMMWIPLVTGVTYTETPASVTRGTVMQLMIDTQTTSAQVTTILMCVPSNFLHADIDVDKVKQTIQQLLFHYDFNSISSHKCHQ